MEGQLFGGVPMNLELRLSVEDSPNSAGVAIDMIRCAKLAMPIAGWRGPIHPASAYFCKHPPKQMTDDRGACRAGSGVEPASRAASNPLRLDVLPDPWRLGISSRTDPLGDAGTKVATWSSCSASDVEPSSAKPASLRDRLLVSTKVERKIASTDANDQQDHPARITRGTPGALAARLGERRSTRRMMAIR